MKQLLFTFFAIVLCYSLFFDDENRLSAVDERNYIYEKTSPEMYLAKDTLGPYVYSIVNYETNLWNPYFYFPDKEITTPFKLAQYR
jgi:hypothetical protein